MRMRVDFAELDGCQPDWARRLHWGWLPGLDYAITQRFDSLSKVAREDKPLLIIHGTADRLVPVPMADELHAAAGSRRERLVKLERASHSGASRHPADADAVRKLLRTTMLASTASLPGPLPRHLQKP